MYAADVLDPINSLLAAAGGNRSRPPGRYTSRKALEKDAQALHALAAFLRDAQKLRRPILPSAVGAADDREALTLALAGQRRGQHGTDEGPEAGGAVASHSGTITGGGASRHGNGGSSGGPAVGTSSPAATARRGVKAGAKASPASAAAAAGAEAAPELQLHCVCIGEALDLDRAARQLLQLQPLAGGVVKDNDTSDKIRSKFIFLPVPDWVSQLKDNTQALSKCLVLHDYGAVVFVNFPAWERQVVLKALTERTIEDLPHEHMLLVVRPTMSGYYRKEHDCAVLKEWNFNNLDIIARVLGQSAAIRYYNAQSDLKLQRVYALMLDLPNYIDTKFGRLAGRFVRKIFSRGGGGTSTSHTQELATMLADSSQLFSHLTFKLRVHETSTAAWDSYKHDRVWQGMRDDYEIDDRFELLEQKLEEIRQQAKYLIELHKSNKSEVYEVVIILLISLEVLHALGLLHTLNVGLQGLLQYVQEQL